jgi:ABC-2 type transport system permease protein
MEQFLAFVKKEFHHIFRDLRTMLILLVMPVIQIVLFGFAISNEVKNAEIAILDYSQDAATKRISAQLAASAYFDISEHLQNINQVDSVFRRGDIGMVVVFGDNFYENLLHTGHALVQLITDATDPNRATSLSNYASAIIGTYQKELMNNQKIPYEISPQVRLLYNPELKGAYNFVPGVLGMILMLICALMTSIAIVRERELGTMEVLLVSPMRPAMIILAKTVPYFILSCVNLVTVLLLSVYVLGVPILGSLFWLVMVSLEFIFLSLSLGLFVSTIANSQVAAMLISGMGFMMPVMMLSGMMFPIENMPLPMQIISNLVPAKWYIIAVKNLMIKGMGFSGVYREMLFLSFYIVVLLTVSIKKFKTRLD